MARQNSQTMTAPPTLSQLLQLIKSDRCVSYNNRRRMTAAVSGLIKHAGVDPKTTHATFSECREPLNAIEPAAARITPGHYAHIRTYLRAAFMRYARGYDARGRRLSRPWLALKTSLGDEGLYRRLIRFIRWCNASGIKPAEVRDEVSVRYLEHLRYETAVRCPENIHKRCCQTWNQMVANNRQWPQIRLSVPSYRTYVALPLDQFHEAFRRDFMSWKAQLASDALIVPGGPEKPLAPLTVVNMAQKILRFASIIVCQGTAVSELTSLAEVVRPHRARAAFEHIWKQNGRKSTRTQYEVARLVKGVARNWVKADQATLTALDQVTRRLHTEPVGLTPKNRALLRQFDDPANVRRFISLPAKLAAQAHRAYERGAIRKAALLMQTAVAIELRLVAPIRFQNLLPLTLGVHFQSVAHDGHRVVYLSIPGSELKNKLPLDFELPKETVELLFCYVRRYLPILSDEGDGMLFPGASRGHKSYGALAAQVKGAIRRYAGVNVSMHAFRHIAAKLHLAQRPHDYLPVSLLLGHLSVQTTMKYYCELERPSAARQYGRDVLGRTFHSLR
jgi:integrase